MDNEKIKELARSFERQSSVNLCVATHYDVVRDFLDWISGTHCIVEKGQVLDSISQNSAYDGYDSLMNNFPEDLIPERTDWHTLQGYADGLYYLIEDIKSMLS